MVPQNTSDIKPHRSTGFAGRPWWQWAAFAALLVAAAVNHFRSRPSDPGALQRVEVPPRTIQISPSLKTAETFPAAAGELSGCNLILVTLDTTRADRLGCYGNDQIHTPTLDALAAQGVIFPNATAVAPTTIPSHSSIMTGLYPRHHGARTNGLFRLVAKHTTLAEALKAADYSTAAVVSAFVLDSRFGLDQGFDVYLDDFSDSEQPEAFRFPERLAEPTTDLALGWLRDNAAQPFFLWLHYFDPHAVYRPPVEFRKLCNGNVYDGEIAYVDAQLARLVALLDELSISDSTLLMVVGDHGESLGQHNESSHGYFVYEATQRVPLIMRCGNRLGGGVIFEPRISQVDLVPTVLSLLNVPAADGLDGVDLTQPLQPRPIFAETFHGTMEHGWAAQFAVYVDQYKYIHGPSPELLDIVADPLEASSLYEEDSPRVVTLLQTLTEFFGDELTSAATPTPTEALGSEDFSRLEALGYVLHGPSLAEANSVRPDPKVMIERLNTVEQIVFGVLPHEGADRAISLLEQVVDEHDDFLPAWRYLGLLYRENGRLDDAISAFENAHRLQPDSSGITYALAYTHAMKGEHQEAIVLLEQNAERYPQHFDTCYLLGTEYLQLKQFSDAADKLRQAFLMQPDFGIAGDQLVGAFTFASRGAELPAILAEGESKAPGSVRVAKARAFYLTTIQRYADADALLRRTFEMAPSNPEAIGGLAIFMASRPDTENRRPFEAVAMLERACQAADYSDPILLYSLSHVYSLTGRLDEAITLSEKGVDIARAGAERHVLTQLMQLQTAQTRARDAGLRATVPAPAPQQP